MFILGCHITDTGLSSPSRQFRGKDRIIDRSGIYGRDLAEEDVAPFQEKRPFLRVEDGKRRIDIDLGNIRLDLAEVRVDGAVQRQIGCESVLHIESGSGINVSILEGSRIISIGQASDLIRDAVRQNLDIVTGAHTSDSLQDSGLTEEAGIVPIEWRPGHLLIALARAETDAMESPFLLIFVWEAKAFEGNGHLSRPSILDNASGRLPDHVKRCILGIKVSKDVHLKAVRIHSELIGRLAIPERIEHDENDIIRLELITITEGRPNRSRVIITMECDV
jgi:hypothetical protein